MNLFLEPIPGAGGGAISFAGFGGGECVCPAGPLGPAGPAGPPGLEVKVLFNVKCSKIFYFHRKTIYREQALNMY